MSPLWYDLGLLVSTSGNGFMCTILSMLSTKQLCNCNMGATSLVSNVTPVE